MPRIKDSINCSKYHYKITNEILGFSKYFMTRQEIHNEFNVSHEFVRKRVKNIDNITTSTKMRNYKIIKLNIDSCPVYKMKENAIYV